MQWNEAIDTLPCNFASRPPFRAPSSLPTCGVPYAIFSRTLLKGSSSDSAEVETAEAPSCTACKPRFSGLLGSDVCFRKTAAQASSSGIVAPHTSKVSTASQRASSSPSLSLHTHSHPKSKSATMFAALMVVCALFFAFTDGLLYNNHNFFQQTQSRKSLITNGHSLQRGRQSWRSGRSAAA
jgi:hypothetical protein